MDTTTSNTNDARRDADGALLRETPSTSQRTHRHTAAGRPSPKADGLASQSRKRTRVAPPRIYQDQFALRADPHGQPRSLPDSPSAPNAAHSHPRAAQRTPGKPLNATPRRLATSANTPHATSMQVSTLTPHANG